MSDMDFDGSDLAVSDVRLRLKEDSLRVLEAVYDEGGVATTSDVKRRTGFSNQKILYRVDNSDGSLAELGLVEVDQLSEAEYGGRGSPPKRFRLTGRAYEAIEDEGLLGDVDSGLSDEVSVEREQFEEFRSVLSQLERRVNALSEEVSGPGGSSEVNGEASGGSSGGVDGGEFEELVERVRGLSDEVGRVEGRVGALEERHEWLFGEFVGQQVPMLRGVFRALKEADGVDVESFVRAEQEAVDDALDVVGEDLPELGGDE